MNVNKTLIEIENIKLPESDLKSHVVIESKKLISTPIKNFTVENLRFMIGQKIGLKTLVPLALDELERNPLISGNLYRGDLFSSLLDIEPNYWKENKELNNRLVEVKKEIQIINETIKEELLPKLQKIDYLE